MNEAGLCTKIRADLLHVLPRAIVTKHHDLSTAGVPDISVNWRGQTLWIEVKLLEARETKRAFLKHFDHLQLANCILLEKQQSTVYFVAYPNCEELRSIVWLPSRLRAFLLQVGQGSSEPYRWENELHYGSYHQAIEFLGFQVGLK